MPQLLSTVKPTTRRIRVRATHTLSPRMHRVVFVDAAATNLTDLAEAPPGAAVKLVFLYERAGSGRTLDRTYMVRRYHTTRGELEIDFAVHNETSTAQHGSAVCRLKYAAPGDEVKLAGPGRSFRADLVAPWTLLIGDETVLPVILTILETLLEHTQVLTYVAIDDTCARLPSEGTLAVYPYSRNIYRVESDTAHTDVMMVGALSAQVMPAGIPQVFLAGEVLLPKQIRMLLGGVQAVPYGAIDTRGYWTADPLRKEHKVSEAR